MDVNESNLNSQHEELIALEAIYAENFVNYGQEFYEVSGFGLLSLLITLECQPQGHTETIPVTLRWVYPKNYPSESPPVFEIISEGIKETHLRDVSAALDKLWKEHQSEVIIFIWMDWLHNSLPAACVSMDYLLKRNEKPQILEQYQLQKINTTRKQEVTEIEEIEEKVKPITKEAPISFPFIHGEPINVKKSTPLHSFLITKGKFQGHVAWISSAEEVNEAVASLKTNKRIYQATHNIFVYRFQKGVSHC
jgi:hypothetical protein